MGIFTYIQDFVRLLYPNNCKACRTPLAKGESVICSFCTYDLPKTNYHKDLDNPMCKLFWGKLPIEHATAFIFFEKGNKTQTLIHQLKYKNVPEIGKHLGTLFGNDLKHSTHFNQVDVVIPVPLHPKKELKRGYNQCKMLAESIAQGLNKPVETNVLFKNLENSSQTKKSRQARWKNVQNAYFTANEKDLTNKHILLIDDVVTTGATTEACAMELLKIEGVKVSIAVLAMAK